MRVVFGLLFVLSCFSLACEKQSNLKVGEPPIEPFGLKGGERTITCKAGSGYKPPIPIFSVDMRMNKADTALFVYSPRLFKSKYKAADIVNKTFSKNTDELQVGFQFKSDDYIGPQNFREFYGKIHLSPRNRAIPLAHEAYDYDARIEVESSDGLIVHDDFSPDGKVKASREEIVGRSVFNFICQNVEKRDLDYSSEKNHLLFEMVEHILDDHLPSQRRPYNRFFNPNLISLDCQYDDRCYAKLEFFFPNNDVIVDWFIRALPGIYQGHLLSKERRQAMRRERARNIRGIMDNRFHSHAGEMTCVIRGAYSFFSLVDINENEEMHPNRKLLSEIRKCVRNKERSLQTEHFEIRYLEDMSRR